MILPGLSGSYVLILMGNYELIMIDAVNNLTVNPSESIKIFLPFIVGAIVGLIAFAHLLSMIFKKFHDQTISLLTGFILGSIPVIWPWKENIVTVLRDGTEKVTGYHWQLPSMDASFAIALFIMIIGAGIIIVTETLANKKSR